MPVDIKVDYYPAILMIYPRKYHLNGAILEQSYSCVFDLDRHLVHHTHSSNVNIPRVNLELA